MPPLLEPLAAEHGSDDPELRGQKSQAAFRTISEVADELDVAQHVLRFWESKFAQVRPLKRGGGRRYYRPEDIELLRQIRSLLYDEGYTIKGAQKLLRGRRSRPTGDEASAATATSPALARPASTTPAGRALSPTVRRRLQAVRGELAEIKDLLGHLKGELP
jgi:DNA-binding transcriptional MerR regulator